MAEIQQLAKGIVRKAGVNSGRPSIQESWTPVFAVAGRFAAGDSIEDLAEDYEISCDSVVDAIRYELGQHPIVS